MQTAAIPYRVADFLKQHPPFEFMDEGDLVGLAARGRVKFHEADEYICWQASPHTPFIYVIQQGTVSLWDESVDPPTLRDIRGAGDSIGIERFNGFATSLHSAKTTSDVVVYALHAADVEALLARNPHAAKYVAAHSAVTADYKGLDESPQAHEILLADLVGGSAPEHCPESTSIREAARLLSESGAQVIALTNEGKVSGLLTTADLVNWVAQGGVDAEQPARSIAGAVPVSVAPQIAVSDCVIAMAESRASAAGLTNDGSRNGELGSIITASSLAPAFGDHPITILDAIAGARSTKVLRALNERARAWILRNLASPAVDWLASFSDLVNRRILERLLQLTRTNEPGQLWCFYGSAGRRELLTAVAPGIAVVGDAPAAMNAALAECGYVSPEPCVGASLDEWKARFSGWIRDPIVTEMYNSRPFFDLRPVQGSEHAFHELESHIRAEMAAEPIFLRLLANDCLSNLPPLTFFRDLVVEESGEKTDTFRLEASALQPLADVARVFSLASGTPLGAPTHMRFEQASRLLPAHESVFSEAAETMRVVLFHQARAGLRLHSSGAAVPLSTLSRHDRQVLKSGFRSIHRLLEFVGKGEWLEAI
jgi:CBS domain-containing protein